MAELLLELLSEEIPARMQERAAEDLKRLVCERLKEGGLDFDRAESFATPRRLALVVDGLPKKQPDLTEERKGPRVGAPEKAIEGFLKSVGLTSLDQCEKRDTSKGEFYFATHFKKGLKTETVLPRIILSAVLAFTWPKSMRWGHAYYTWDDLTMPWEDANFTWNDASFRWVRPLYSILAIYNRLVLEGSVPTGTHRAITFGNSTIGHRFLAPKPFQVKDFADYKAKLKKAKVILDAAERCRVIEREAERLAAAAGLKVKADPALVAENAGMVEWPVVLMGKIDPEFMDVPPEVLTTVMRHHLKQFAVLDKKGKLAPRFLVIAGTRTKDKGKQIVAGNERVLRARLADAKFFWHQDRKRTLESRIADLNGIIFHAKLGSLGEKAERIEALAGEIAAKVSGADTVAAREAARLCKVDLTTEMVGEFPELQGVMGRYYALEEKMPAEVADAIAKHYAPQGPNDACPSKPVSVAVALADKIDSLVGFWSIDEKPTGSKDPFALRRAALGVIRLIVENELRVSLCELFHKAYELYPLEIRASKRVTSPHFDIGAISIHLLLFFIDRLKVHLREKGVRHDLINAVVGTHRLDVDLEDNLVRLLDKVDAIKEFLAGEDGINLLTAYKRTANILRIEGEKDGVAYKGADVDDELLRERDEQVLAARLGEVSALADAALGHEDFAAAMSALAQLRKPVDAFFDQVMVNCDDADLRRNRLRLLATIRNTIDRVADFSKIEG
ncbi:MAG: glycine--tRNA ligase subunit beta [Kiloniellales bacterium]